MNQSGLAFFEVTCKDGRRFKTSALSPAYREEDHAALLQFPQPEGLVSIESRHVASVIFNEIPFPRR